MNKSQKQIKMYVLFFLIIYTIALITLKRFVYLENNEECFYDPILKFFYPLNRIINKHYNLKSIIEIVNGAMIDFINISYMIYYFLYFFLLSIPLGLFYFTRQFMFSIFIFPIPNSNIFFEPYIKSILISYKLSNDYYYSGHCGNLMLFTLTHKKLKNTKFFYFSLLSLIYTVFYLLIYSAHYSIDITVGIMACYSFFKITTNNKYYIKIIFIRLLDKIWINLLKFKNIFKNKKSRNISKI